MNRKALLLLAVLGVTAHSVSAAVQYQFRETHHSEVRGVPSMDVTGRAVIDGDRSRIDYLGGVGGYPAGSYFIALDGARTVTFVDPSSRSYSEVNTANATSAVGSARITVSNVKTELQQLDDHPQVAGFTTDHSRLTMTYVMTMTFGAIVLRQDVRTVIDKWTTSEFGSVSENFLASGLFHTGNAELDKVMEAETTHNKGLPLKKMTRVTTTSQNGRVPDSKLPFSPARNQLSEYVVTEIHSTAVPASLFRVPAGFSKTESHTSPSDLPLTNVTMQPSGK